MTSVNLDAIVWGQGVIPCTIPCVHVTAIMFGDVDLLIFSMNVFGKHSFGVFNHHILIETGEDILRRCITTYSLSRIFSSSQLVA